MISHNFHISGDASDLRWSSLHSAKNCGGIKFKQKLGNGENLMQYILQQYCNILLSLFGIKAISICKKLLQLLSANQDIASHVN